MESDLLMDGTHHLAEPSYVEQPAALHPHIDYPLPWIDCSKREVEKQFQCRSRGRFWGNVYAARFALYATWGDSVVQMGYYYGA